MHRKSPINRSLLLILTLALPLTTPLDAQPSVLRVTTVAGKTATPSADTDPLSVKLTTPIGIAMTNLRDLYIGDFAGNQIWKVSSAGRATVLAGTGAPGNTGTNAPATAALLTKPRAMATDFSRNLLYFSESGTNRVRRVNLFSGWMEFGMGTGNPEFGSDGNPGTQTNISEVLGMVTDSVGNLYFTDSGNHRVRRMAQNGIVTTVAGNGTVGKPLENAVATTSALNTPAGIARAANGDIYFSDIGNGVIYRLRNGLLTTVAGNSTAIALAGDALQVKLTTCLGMTMNADSSGLYFTEEATDTIRFLNLNTQQVTLIGGNGTQGYSGDNGPAVQAAFGNPNHIVRWGSELFVADAINNRIRRITADGTVSTYAGGAGAGGDGGPALGSPLQSPVSVKLDPNGNLVVVDQAACRVLRVSPAGILKTLAGVSDSCLKTGMTTALSFSNGGTVFSDRSQTFLAVNPTLLFSITFAIKDMLLSRDGSRVYFLAGNGFPVVYTGTPVQFQTSLALNPIKFAGGTGAGSGGDGGPALANVLSSPNALAEDRNGNLYILDPGNQNIRRVDAASRTISTIVQDPKLANAKGIAVDPAGNIFASVNSQVAVYKPNGDLLAFAGGPPGNSADGFDGPAARLNNPSILSASSDGSVYVADTGNGLVRRLSLVQAASLEAQSTSATTPGNVPVQVLLRASDGAPLSTIGVQFSITPSTAKLSATSGFTGADGTATVIVTLGDDSAVVTASVDGLPPVAIDVSSTRSVPSARPDASIAAAISLGDFGAAKTIAPGGWMEIYGTNLSGVTQEWAGGDFVSGSAPTTLAGVKVLINSIPAFIQRVSPGQISCVAPDGIGSGEVSVVVVNGASQSGAFKVTAADRAPALLAPLSFKSGDKQYVVALFPDRSFVGPAGLIAGAPFRPAAPGDSLVLYGIAFGSTSPTVPAGKVASIPAVLPNVEVSFGNIPAKVDFAGLAAGFVGLYQLNVVVPSGTVGDQRLSVKIDGIPSLQTLWIATR